MVIDPTLQTLTTVNNTPAVKVRLLVDHYPTSKITKVLGINSAQLSTAINSQSDFTFVTASTDGLNNPADSTHQLPIESIDEKYFIDAHRPYGDMLRITT